MAISSLFRRRELHVETPGRWTYVCMGIGLASEILTFGLAAEKSYSPIRFYGPKRLGSSSAY